MGMDRIEGHDGTDPFSPYKRRIGRHIRLHHSVIDGWDHIPALDRVSNSSVSYKVSAGWVTSKCRIESSQSCRLEAWGWAGGASRLSQKLVDFNLNLA